MTDISKHWVKLGNMVCPKLSDEVFDAEQVVEHNRVANSFDNKWYHRTYAPTLTFTNPVDSGGLAERYLLDLNLPKFDYRSVTFSALFGTLEWHIDSVRDTAINFYIQNGELGLTELVDNTSYEMNPGDIYALNTKAMHRVKFLVPEITEIDLRKARIILTVSVPYAFDSDETRNILKDLNGYFTT
jgi:hypothetical protein